MTSIEEFQVVASDHQNVSDDQVEKIFLEFPVNSAETISQIADILKTYRPNVVDHIMDNLWPRH